MFETGFQGSVQVLAEQLVVLNEDVILKYPSGILINKGVSEKKEVRLKKNSKVLGAVVVYDQDKSAHKIIKIDKKAEVVGDVFCSGKIQLTGKIIGTVYTSSFYLKTEASTYDNYIMNGMIDRKNLPNDFVRIPLFQHNHNRLYGAIKPM
ncbi:hypothetical protein N7U66_03310 [Lacinutrix neustonica]|uniref:Uncharacterized protein n=1 Tax=Lacinutrix neustonica TaxID=2980107 RepID=A0A9E8MY85_9FLAO|nr:hypothetical protein [Lacinutrix neustonica]WAC02712.1 hypothetical protein N7U66_03310 [Lacinutrix neustonica]